MINKYIIITLVAASVLAFMYASYMHDKAVIQEQKTELHNKDVKIQKQKQETKNKSFEARQKAIKEEWAKKVKSEKAKKDKNETNISNFPDGTYSVDF